MQEDLGNLAYPVLTYGLDLRDRLARGESPALASEQAALRRLLLTDLEAGRWPDYGGDGDGLPPGTSRTEAVDAGTAAFLGARYALACWLDELFILYSPWEAAWNERKLEVGLYGTNDRAWKFWQQARLAEGRSSTDALEVFFLCVMLGFRGELGEDAEKLRAWVNSAQARLTRAGQEWPHPPALDPPTNVPPLHGRDRFRRMVYYGSLALLLLIPLVSFLVVQQLSE
jgi:type VI secretion system protein ImpK